MEFSVLSKENYEKHIASLPYVSFLQTVEMADLLEKRGYQTKFVGLTHNGETLVSAILYSMPMTGGLMMEINSGPNHNNPEHLSAFYDQLKDYAKANGALELRVKPYDTYQTFDTNGEPIDEERPQLIKDFTNLGYEHDGLTTGYPGGEPDWHYVKDLQGLDKNSLFKSYSKKGRPLVKKARTFGIKLKKLKRDELAVFKEITSATSDRRQYTDKPLDYYEDFYDAFGDKAEFLVATINFQEYIDNLKANQQKLKDKIAKLQPKSEDEVLSTKRMNQIREFTSQSDTFDKRIEEANEFLEEYGTEDTVLSGSLFIYTPQESYYLFSGSYTQFNKFYAPAILQEHVLNKSIELGIPLYNFLGISGEFDGSDGVLGFKQNFNGYITRKMGTFRYYPKPLKYKAINTIKKLLGR